MKYCVNCGNELADETVICPKCGSYNDRADQVVENKSVNSNSGLKTAALIFMILGTVASVIYIVPLAWCLPMTISYAKRSRNNEYISTAFKVCSLLFVSLVAGILMLCDNSTEPKGRFYT